MLKLFSLFFGLFLSLEVLACWKIEGSFAVDGETWKINQKIEHNKEYIIPAGTFIFKFSVESIDKKNKRLNYAVHEKKGTNLTLVTKGDEDNILIGKEREIFAKGEENQPNSIIIIKLTDI